MTNSRPPSLIPTARRVLLALVVFSLPFELGFTSLLFEVDPNALQGYRRFVASTVPLDVAQVLLAILAAPVVYRSWRSWRRSWAVPATTLIAAASTLALVFNPSSLGVALTLRFWVAVAVAAVASELDREGFRIFVALPLLAAAGAGAVLGLAQTLIRDTGTFVFGSWHAGTGFASHPYVLAGVLLLAVTVGIALVPQGRGRTVWLTAVGVAAAGFGTTFGRAGLVGFVLVAGTLLWGIRRSRARYLTPSFAAIVPAAAVGLFTWDGWWDRIRTTFQTDIDVAGTGRLRILGSGLRIAASQPFLGTGPGRYLIALATEEPDLIGTKWFELAHMVPVLMVAELGIVAGFLYAVFLVIVGVRAFRTSPIAAAIFCSLIAFVLFDKFTFAHPNGIVMHALWLAALDLLARRGVDPDPLPKLLPIGEPSSR